MGLLRFPNFFCSKSLTNIRPNYCPYAVGTPAVFGFAEWNGRSLTDNAPGVMFSFASNSPISLGIGKESVALRPTKVFSYVVPVS